MKTKQGFIAINKPRNVSSAAVVNKIKFLLRSNLNKYKTGHMGTLDVDAEGVLIVAIGRATRLFDLFLEKQKTYETVFKFGLMTDTDDTTGEILKTCKKIPSQKEILKAIKIVKKQKTQMPPKFCANVVNGVRAYNLARKGEEFALKPKPIEIYSFKLLKQVDDVSFKFEITCSSGTYIRAICRDLSALMSTYGITSSIIRTRCGVFSHSDCLEYTSLSFENLQANIKEICECFPHIKQISINESEFFKLKNGLAVLFSLPDGYYFINKIMLAECIGGLLKQKIYLGVEND